MYLEHHGILGQKWGIRRYQNKDGSLTPAGRKRLQKADLKWSKKNEEKIYNATYKKSRSELSDYVKNDLNKNVAKYNSNGQLSSNYINAYNKKLAEVMNKNVGDIQSPSGRVVRYVAKRGSVGIYTALADSGYDMNNVRNGVWESGRIGYRKNGVEIAR